jgi:hypothetical protein
MLVSIPLAVRALHDLFKPFSNSMTFPCSGLNAGLMGVQTMQHAIVAASAQPKTSLPAAAAVALGKEAIEVASATSVLQMLSQCAKDASRPLKETAEEFTATSPAKALSATTITPGIVSVRILPRTSCILLSAHCSGSAQLGSIDVPDAQATHTNKSCSALQTTFH